MNYTRMSRESSIHSAMIASDVMAFLETLFFQNGEAEGTLKKGEVAFKGLRKPRLKIYDPKNPAHYIICNNNMSYPQDDTEVVYMNPIDFAYFKNLGFEAGDEVYIVEA